MINRMLNLLLLVKIVLLVFLVIFHVLLLNLGVNAINFDNLNENVNESLSLGYKLSNPDVNTLQKIKTIGTIIVGNSFFTFTELIKTLVIGFTGGVVNLENINNQIVGAVLLFFKIIDIVISMYGIIVAYALIRGNFTI